MAILNSTREAEMRGGLEKIIGPANVGGSERMEWVFGQGQTLAGKIVVQPGNPGEVAEILHYAEKNRTPVVPFGNGSRLGDVCPGESRGIFLSTSRMASVLELEIDNLSVTVEAGLGNGILQQQLLSKGLFLPVFSDGCESTLGGQAARNHSGWRRYRHGKIGDYILGASFISPQGKLIKTGGKTVKNASGYDLTKLIPGSWGTLGIISSIIFRLLPLPEKLVLITADFPTLEEGLRVAGDILGQKTVLSSLNIFSTGDQESSNNNGWSWAMVLEGSFEAVASHQASLGRLLPRGCRVEEQVQHDFFPVYHQTRSDLHSGRRATVIFDKRRIPSLAPLLLLLLQHDAHFDCDLSSGVIEFTVPAHKHGATPFKAALNQCIATLQPGVCVLFDHVPPQPLLDRLSAQLDPAGIMFPSNLFRGGRAHGQGI
jgi:hypothetical protein